jgi:hypothetical protein
LWFHHSGVRVSSSALVSHGSTKNLCLNLGLGKSPDKA